MRHKNTKLCCVLILLAMSFVFLSHNSFAASEGKYRPLIVMITDLGETDYYTGIIKGVIYSKNSNITIDSITNNIEPFNIRQAAYMLAETADSFPVGTIFLAVVDPGSGTGRKPIAFETKEGYFFVGPDNGIFTHILEKQELKQAFEITNPDIITKTNTSAFDIKNIFAPAAVYISNGNSISGLGQLYSKLVTFDVRKFEYDKDQLSGEVVYTDHFGNLITNIPDSVLEKTNFKPGQTVSINIDGKTFKAKLGETYADVPEGHFVLLSDGKGHLQIARNMASARDDLGADYGSEVVVFFEAK